MPTGRTKELKNENQTPTGQVGRDHRGIPPLFMPAVKPSLMRHSLKTRITLFVLAIFVLSLWALAYVASQVLQEDMERLLNDEKESVAHMVAEKINEQLQLRFEALELRAERIDERLMTHPKALQAHLEDRVVINQLFNGGFYVADSEGTAIASVPVAVKRIGISYMFRNHVASALKEGKAAISTVEIGKALQAPVFSLAVPIRNAQGQIIGCLVGIINLNTKNFLDQTMQPYGKTGGFVIVSRPQRMAVTATDKSRVMEPQSAPGVNPALDRFLDGYEGSTVFVNQNGVEMYQSAHDIPLANWYVAVELPAAEVLAPIRAMQQRMLWATMLLSLLAGGLIWWILGRQLKPMQVAAATLREHVTSGKTPNALPNTTRDEIGQLIGGFNQLLETLRQREGLLQMERDSTRNILATVEAMIIALDPAGRVTLINRKACEILGYREDELIGQDWFATCMPRSSDQVRAVFKQVIAGKLAGSEYAENPVRTRSGDERLIAWHNSSIRDKEGNIIGALTAGEDITERKQAALQLAESEAKHHAELSTALDGQRQAARTALSLMEDAVSAKQQAEAMSAKLTEQVDELSRWQQAMLDREDRIITVKQEVNELLAQLDQPPRYGDQLPADRVSDVGQPPSQAAPKSSSKQ